MLKPKLTPNSDLASNLASKKKFSRKRKTKDPCEGCAVHKSLCICSLIPSLDLRTRLSLVVHAKELKRTTNTGQLALKSLKNSAMYVRGEDRTPLDLSCLLDSVYQPLFFYPSDDAVELSTDFLSRFDRPIHLIVPDGNWRQASKVHIRHSELANVPRVMLKIALPAAMGVAVAEPKQFMRVESKPEGMATLEAIAYAMRVLEGEDVFKSLIAVYNAKLRATLIGRGQSIVDVSSLA